MSHISQHNLDEHYINMEVIASQYQAAIASVSMSLPVKLPGLKVLQHLGCFSKEQQSLITLF